MDSPSSERNHKVTRVIGELPIAQYSESPRRYGVRDTQLPCLLSSPSVYMTPRPGFPQRVLPTTPSRNEVIHIFLYYPIETPYTFAKFVCPLTKVSAIRGGKNIHSC